MNLFERAIHNAEDDLFAPDYERATVLKHLHKDLDAAGAKDVANRLKYITVAFEFSTHDSEDEEGYFKPMIVWSDGRAYPTFDALPAEAWQVYREEAERSPNSVMRARYADLIWEKDADQEYARVALDNYVEYAEIYLQEFLSGQEDSQSHLDMHMTEALKRALQLAARLGDKALMNQAIAATLSAVDSLLEHHQPRWCIDLLEAVEGRPKIAEEIAGPDEIGRRIDKLIEQYREQPLESEPWHLLRTSLGLKVQHVHKYYGQEAARKGQLAIAQTYIEEAKWKHEHYPQGNSVAASLYRNAIDEFRRAGASREDIGPHLKRLEDLNRASIGEMKKISVPVEIPQEVWEEERQRFERIADELGIQFLCVGHWFIPDISELRDTIRAEMKEHPLLSLLSTVSVDDDRISSAAGTPEEREHAELVRALLLRLQFVALYVKWGIDYLKKVKALGADDATQALSECPVIEAWRLELLRTAMERYFADDLVSFMHIAILQIEGILRNVLRMSGKSTTIAKRSEGGTVTQAMPLGDILRDEALQQALGDDFIFVLRALLAEQPGLNLRNDIAHGLLLPAAFSQTYANIVLLALFQVAALREESDSDDKTAEQEEEAEEQVTEQ